MCCRGVIYPDALLDDDEFERAGRHELPVVANGAGLPAFALPCRHHVRETNVCSIYDDRFHVCRRYRCDLLTAVGDGRVDVEDAIATARAARAVESRIYDHLGGYDATTDLWTAIADHIAASGIDDEHERTLRFAALLLDARLLSLLLNRHFEARLHRRLNAGPATTAPLPSMAQVDAPGR